MWAAIGGLAGRVARGVKHAVGIREKSMIHLQHGLEQFEQETGSLTSDFITNKVNIIKKAEREVAVLEKKIKKLEPPNNGGGLNNSENRNERKRLTDKITVSKNKYSAAFIDLRNSIERVRDNKRNNTNQKWFNAWSRLYDTIDDIIIFLDTQNWVSNSFNSNNYVEGENDEEEEKAVVENNHGNNGSHGEVESVQGSEGEGSVGHDPNVNAVQEASVNAAALEASFNANNQSQVSRNANLQAEQARLVVEVAEAQARSARNVEERAEANRKANKARNAEKEAQRIALEAEAQARNAEKEAQRIALEAEAARNAEKKARQKAEYNNMMRQLYEQEAERNAANRVQQEEWARAEREASIAQQVEANRRKREENKHREREANQQRREAIESREREDKAKRNAEEKRKREAKEAQERQRKVQEEENARRNAEERLLRNALKQNQNLRNTSKNLNRRLGKYFRGLRELRELKKEVKPTGFFSKFTNKIKRVFSRGNTQKKQLRMRNASERFSNMNTNYKALEKLNEDQIKNENVRNKLRLTKKLGKCAVALSEIEKRNSEYNDKYYNNSPKTLRNKFQRGLEKIGRYFMSRGNRNARSLRLKTKQEQVDEFKRQEHDYVSRCKQLEESAQQNISTINRKLTTKFPN